MTLILGTRTCWVHLTPSSNDSLC